MVQHGYNLGVVERDDREDIFFVSTKYVMCAPC